MNAGICFVFFSFFLLWFIINQLVYYVSVCGKKFLSLVGIFHDKDKEWDMVLIYSCMALTSDSTYFCALCHVILLITLWYIIIPTLPKRKPRPRRIK